MEEEVRRHSEKIYNITKNLKKTYIEKFKEIIIEILIIVFAVTVSIWLHSWSEHNHQQTEAKEFLKDLKDDLIKDINKMNNQKFRLVKTVNNYTILRDLNSNQVTSLKNTNLKFDVDMDLIFRNNNIGNYEGFKSSGKIGYIENKKLKKQILGYYQQDIPELEEVEKIYNTQVEKIIDLTCENKNGKELFMQNTFKTSLSFAIQFSNNAIKSYESSIKLAKEIVDEIDVEIK